MGFASIRKMWVDEVGWRGLCVRFCVCVCWGGVFGFPVMAATSHRPCKPLLKLAIVIIIPDKVIIARSFLLPASFGIGRSTLFTV